MLFMASVASVVEIILLNKWLHFSKRYDDNTQYNNAIFCASES